MNAVMWVAAAVVAVSGAVLLSRDVSDWVDHHTGGIGKGLGTQIHKYFNSAKAGAADIVDQGRMLLGGKPKQTETQAKAEHDQHLHTLEAGKYAATGLMVGPRAAAEVADVTRTAIKESTSPLVKKASEATSKAVKTAQEKVKETFDLRTPEEKLAEQARVAKEEVEKTAKLAKEASEKAAAIIKAHSAIELSELEKAMALQTQALNEVKAARVAYETAEKAAIGGDANATSQLKGLMDKLAQAGEHLETMQKATAAADVAHKAKLAEEALKLSKLSPENKAAIELAAKLEKAAAEALTRFETLTKLLAQAKALPWLQRVGTALKIGGRLMPLIGAGVTIGFDEVHIHELEKKGDLEGARAMKQAMTVEAGGTALLLVSPHAFFAGTTAREIIRLKNAYDNNWETEVTRSGLGAIVNDAGGQQLAEFLAIKKPIEQALAAKAELRDVERNANAVNKLAHDYGRDDAKRIKQNFHDELCHLENEQPERFKEVMKPENMNVRTGMLIGQMSQENKERFAKLSKEDQAHVKDMQAENRQHGTYQPLIELINEVEHPQSTKKAPATPTIVAAPAEIPGIPKPSTPGKG